MHFGTFRVHFESAKVHFQSALKNETKVRKCISALLHYESAKVHFDSCHRARSGLILVL